MVSTGLLSSTVISDSEFRKKYALKLLASPFSLVPIIGGLTDVIILWAFGICSGPAVFTGLAGILGGLGIFLTRLAVGNRDTAGKVLESIQKDAIRDREKALDDLDQRLTADGDPRTENCLRELRALAKVFEQNQSWTGALKDSTSIDILSGVDRLFRECVLSLEKTLELHAASLQTTTAGAKKLIVKEREGIIADIIKSIHHLGTLLDGIHSLEITETGSSESGLAHIRKELDQSLEVAKKVKEQMASLDREIDADE